MANYRNDLLREILSVTKALADENRVRILMALRQRDLCVCQITELLQLAPSTVSKHISILRQARLVEPQKDGRWIHYHLPSEISAAAQSAISLLERSLAHDRRIGEDRRRLREILKIDKETLCKRQ